MTHTPTGWPRSRYSCSALAFLAAGLCVLILASHGCAAEAEDLTEEEILKRLIRQIDRELPRAWRIGTVEQVSAEVDLDLEGQGLVAYRPEPVALQRRDAEGDPIEAVLHFYIERRLWIEPEEYGPVYRENERIRQQHTDVLRQVAHIPRRAEGELMPRDQYEQATVNRFREQYASLADYDRNLPTHHYRSLSFRLHDPRRETVPAERSLQTEMNVAYAAIGNVLTSYR